MLGKIYESFKLILEGITLFMIRRVLQQIAPRDYYERPEKLIYKFIGKNLVFVYDNEKDLV